MLVVRRIRVTYSLSGVEPEQQEAVERVLVLHQERCPVARTIAGCVDITTRVEYR